MAMRLIILVTLLAFLNGLLGCSNIVLLSPEELKQKPQKNILAAKLTSGEEIHFESPGGVFVLEKQVLQGTIRDTTLVSSSQAKYIIEDVAIQLEDIDCVKVKELHAGKTIGCILGATAIGIGLFVFIIAPQLEKEALKEMF